jgi:hypothetical protein
MSTTYKHLSIYEILSMLSGDLLVDPNLLLETLDENPEQKALVLDCTNNKITYAELLERVTEII